ncbi:MAG: ATP-binding cassette domain-containing protein, partial [Myxococcota bacterium]|nr:ATP-binding cassette domain-containing protein [Myxococcota bacterium]
TGLNEDASRPIQGYSQGMRRKTAIACALVSKPKLIVLDESLNGLDPPSVERVLNALEELRQAGSAIILSTHVLDTLERLATRIVLLSDGKLLGDWPGGQIEEVRSYFQQLVAVEDSRR